jgi:hypothetical protein
MTTKSIVSLGLVGAAIGWYFLIEWLRRRLHKKTIHTGSAPNTQYLALLGALGTLALMTAALIVLCSR